MPKHVKTWDQFKRTADYIRAFTVGVPLPGGMGRAYHASVHTAFKNTDAAFDQRFNKRVKTYLKFCEQWNALQGDKLQESASISHLMMGYFNENPQGEACIVNSGQNTPTKVEVRNQSGSWVEVWSK